MIYSTRDLLYVFPCIILFLSFSVLLVLRLPRLGKRELACLDLSVSSSSWGWEGLRFVIVALPGLFSYLFSLYLRCPHAKSGLGWGLTICLWLGPPWFNYWFSFTLAYSRISHEYSSLFIIVINLIFMFSL